MTSFDKLKWQCRRGTLELDLMLQSYLDTGYLQVDDKEKAQFVKLLKWDDDELLKVLLGGKEPDEAGFDSLIDKLRRIAATYN